MDVLYPFALFSIDPSLGNGSWRVWEVRCTSGFVSSDLPME
jgi:hypothetical protein